MRRKNKTMQFYVLLIVSIQCVLFLASSIFFNGLNIPMIIIAVIVALFIYAVSTRLESDFLYQSRNSDIPDKERQQENNKELTQKKEVEEALSDIKGIESDVEQLVELISDAHARLQDEFLSMIDKISDKNDEVKNNISKILIALQFEDIVRQIAGRMSTRIISVRQIINGPSGNVNATSADEICTLGTRDNDFDDQDEEYTPSEIPMSANKPLAVEQKNLSKGSMELF